jgi:hypothetical protein
MVLTLTIIKLFGTQPQRLRIAHLCSRLAWRNLITREIFRGIDRLQKLETPQGPKSQDRISEREESLSLALIPNARQIGLKSSA